MQLFFLFLFFPLIIINSIKFRVRFYVILDQWILLPKHVCVLENNKHWHLGFIHFLVNHQIDRSFWGENLKVWLNICHIKSFDLGLVLYDFFEKRLIYIVILKASNYLIVKISNSLTGCLRVRLITTFSLRVLCWFKIRLFVDIILIFVYLFVF